MLNQILLTEFQGWGISCKIALRSMSRILWYWWVHIVQTLGLYLVSSWQAITWANTDLDPCRWMTSLGYNDWMRPYLNILAMIYTIFSHLWLYSFIDLSNITPVLIYDGRFSQSTISTLTKYPQMFVWAEQIATITLCYAMVSYHEIIHTYSVDTKWIY